MRDPKRMIVEEQLNGGEFVELSPADWALILPYLRENENLFGISVEQDLLSSDGMERDYREIYRKVQATRLEVLAKVSAVAEEWGEDWRE